MEVSGFPTSSDIYLEVNGKKVAVVQSYRAQSTKTSQSVEAFGESEPVATIQGAKSHVVELTRLYATDEAIADGLDFHTLEDFSLVICKPDRLPRQPASARAAAAELYAAAAQVAALYAEAEWVKNQSFPQTAAREYLDYHATMRGLTRKEAAQASGMLRFSVSEAAAQDLTVEAGTVCRTAGDVRFETTQEATLAAGTTSVDVSARALNTGAAGNAAAGSVTLMVGAPVGITGCTNPEAFSGGADGEDDEALRTRVLATFARVSNGANAAYYEQAALDYPGVAAVRVLPRNRGTGTVDLVVSTPSGTPPAELLTGLQAALETEREIATDVDVLAPTTVTVDVAASLALAEEADWETVVAAAAAALGACFDGTQLSEDVLLAKLGSVLFAVPGVFNYALTAPAADVPIADTEMPVLGTLTLTQAT
ncbi:MAG TPA: baseplate J/gp47 family protein [Oscillospiraceae bacterium]|nr:baseplate J/gp47 family protein [Oscillospiraceae bacterium]